MVIVYLDIMVIFVKWIVVLDVLVKFVLEVMGFVEVVVKLDIGVCFVIIFVNFVMLMDVFRIMEYVYFSVYLVFME